MRLVVERKARWMAAFEAYVLQLDAKYAGRIEWDSAQFFFNNGDSAFAAAEQYVTTRAAEDEW